MRILITGGAGFVGFNLLTFLSEKYKDIQLVTIDNLKRRGSELNVTKIQQMGVEFHHIDIKIIDELSVLKDVDLVIHCASESSVLSGITDSSKLLLGNNLLGSINIFEYAVKCKSKLIYFSSNRVYPTDLLNEINYETLNNRFQIKLNQKITGVSSKGISENFPLNGSKTFYGASKICGENLLEEYSQYYGLQYVNNRFGVISGRGQFGYGNQGIIAFWLKQHFLSGELKYLGYGGEGLQVRDALHIRDLCHLVDIQINEFSKVCGKTFNIGGGYQNSFSLNELTSLCQKITQNIIEVGCVHSNRLGDIPIYYTDNSKVTECLKWKPKLNIHQILEEIYDWYKSDEEMLNYF